MIDGYPKKAIDYLNDDNKLLNTYNTDVTLGISSYPDTIDKKVVTQDESGVWSEQYVNQESPVKSPQKEKQEERDTIDSKIEAIQQTSSILDKKILEFNNLINIKKSQIVNLVATAIGAGCSYISTTGSGGAGNVGGVAIGVGLTVYNDSGTIGVYPNLYNYGVNNPFSSNIISTLTFSNAGTGYTSSIVNNNTASSVGSYSSIPTTTGQHSGAPSPSACAGYGSSIISIAAELSVLRNKRNGYLLDLYDLKDKSTEQEIIRWGLKRSDQFIEDQKVLNTELITLIDDRASGIEPNPYEYDPATPQVEDVTLFKFPRAEFDYANIGILTAGKVGIDSTNNTKVKLDVYGSVKIDAQIYDSTNNAGVIGAFLTKDTQGIKWTDFAPTFSEGIFVYNEGILVGVQSFRGINVKTGRSSGIGTDPVQAIVNPSTSNIADISVYDSWDFNTAGNIYRMTDVGIRNNNPSSTLDISGTLHATGGVDLDSTLNVDGAAVLQNTLNVRGATDLDSTLNVDGAAVLQTTLNVKGATDLDTTLNVDGAATLQTTLNVKGATDLDTTLNVDGATVLQNTLNVKSATDLDSTLNVDGAAVLQTTLNVKGATDLDTTLNVDGATSLNNTLGVTGATNLSNTLGVTGATTLSNTLGVTGATTLSNTLGVTGATNLNSTLQVGVGGTVITTTGIGSVGIGTNSPTKDIDFARDVIIRKALYDSNRKVGYDTNFYQTPRSVLTQVAVGATGEIIGGRFFDAANMIRLNLDFIANEAIGFLTSTSYKSPAFVVPGVGGVSTCRSDIKKILKAITLDITKGGNSQSVGAGLSYYNGPSLIHITGNDTNGYSIKDATIVAITTAAQIARYVINNVTLPRSYQSGVSSVRQVRDLTLQDDAAVGFNTSLSGCSNVVSAITVCAGIVTTIIGGGPSASPNITYPDGKIIWAPAGADSRNIIWVSKYGNDDNGGKTEGDAKLTIGAACEIAESGDTIMVRSGVYYENNPIGLKTDVSISGQDLRLVTVVPKNLSKDVFHVRRGCLIENMNFSCETGQSNPGGGAVAFPPTTTDILAGKSYGAVTGYTAPGPATEGPSGRWRSPYVRNCTNFMSKSIGMKIDGNHATASTIGSNLKTMVLDAFTQYNEAGIGVSITNNGYAQLVSLFTICCDKAVYCDTGGQCDLTNSNSSFGNYGLYAVGLGATEFTGIVTTTTTAEADIITLANVTDGSQYRRPYDGQALWFKINLSNYNTGQTGIITAPMQRLKSITVINGGSGYSQSVPPDITIYDNNTNDDDPLGPEGIIAELSPTISDSGAITSVDVVNSGRNYLSSQNMKVRINGVSTNDLTPVMEPIYYTVAEATLPTSVGITTVTLNEFVPYLVYANDNVEMRRISRILTSGHSFEYIGSGTDINTSTPLQGAVPIKDNEVVALDGAQIPYTSTDQKGNFNIGEGIQVNQTTASISGRDFNKAIQAQVTPLILALR